MILNEKDLLCREKQILSEYAAKSDSELLIRRIEKEEKGLSEGEFRLPFQHDRDRVIHSRAFRRLMHKTQIFNANKGDHYRNRLTHTLEVSQIARSIGKSLGLNDELIEAIALGHDLGHTPFGHTGERTLHEIISGELFNNSNSIIVRNFGGFKHNYQSMHIVDNLENSSNLYKGMNLTLAVREGVLKHTGCKFKETGIAENIKYECLNLNFINVDRPSFTLEGQVVGIADEIAQCTHDLEDGIRSKIIKIGDVEETELVEQICNDNGIDIKKLISTVDIRNVLIRSMVGFLINDVCMSFDKKFAKIYPNENYPKFQDENDVYIEQIIDFSEKVKLKEKSLSARIKELVIMSQQISQADSKSKYIIKKLFEAYFDHPQQLPDYILERYFKKQGKSLNRTALGQKTKILQNDADFVRLICDHISGMTDQYIAREYKNLFEPEYI